MSGFSKPKIRAALIGHDSRSGEGAAATGGTPA
jgi:hypothetical protein